MPFYIWGIGIVAAFVIFSLIYSFATKSTREQKEKANPRKTESVESRVDEFRLTNGRRDYLAADTEKSSSANKNVKGTRLTAPEKPKKSKLIPNVSLSANIKSRAENHTHPLEEGAKYRIERVDMGGSLGGEITEGCADQYFQRLVKLDKEEVERAEPNYDLIKTVVFGEMLAKPKFKK